MNKRKTERQRNILTRIRSPFPSRREDWKLVLERDDQGRLFIYQTKDDKPGRLIVRIKPDWSCEVIEASGQFERKKDRLEEIVHEINRGMGKMNGKSVSS